jgi:hypothetical protein
MMVPIDNELKDVPYVMVDDGINLQAAFLARNQDAMEFLETLNSFFGVEFMFRSLFLGNIGLGMSRPFGTNDECVNFFKKDERRRYPTKLAAFGNDVNAAVGFLMSEMSRGGILASFDGSGCTVDLASSCYVVSPWRRTDLCEIPPFSTAKELKMKLELSGHGRRGV